jgi:hypothetical protein
MTTEALIPPSPGRIVWFYPAEHDGIGRLNGQPLAAIVAGIHTDRLVNLAVFDAYGNTQQRSNVHLVQPGEERPNSAHATWMPYQIGQAAKTIELPVVDTPVETSTNDMLAESDGTSASETGLVNTATESDGDTGGENTEAPAAA